MTFRTKLRAQGSGPTAGRARRGQAVGEDVTVEPETKRGGGDDEVQVKEFYETFGAWKDPRSAEEIIRDIRSRR